MPALQALSVPLAHLALALSLVQAPPELRREPLMAALRQGGYTVILRHARTDRSFQEARDYVPKERGQQRNLNDDGVRDAALMGVVFRRHRVSFAEVVSSPMYRTVETAEMAAGTPDTTMALRAIPATPEQRALINRAPAPGTNRLLVTHHFVIETHVPGIHPGDIGESEAVVVRAGAGGTVELVGRITLDDWRALASPGGAAAAVQSAAPAHPAPAGHGVPGVGAVPPPAPGAPARIPDTHAGHIASAYLAAFNSGSRDVMRTFIGEWMVPNPDRPLEERLETYVKLFTEHGPLSLEAVERSESTEITLGLRSRRGSFRMTVTSSDAQPMRASSVRFAMMQGAHP